MREEMKELQESIAKHFAKQDLLMEVPICLVCHAFSVLNMLM